ncbi:MAG TPA: hypothetical protein VH351_07125 [Bryobacteraceae bacterium]|jgi:hypothetical protein|nr:hypothetical protein [Bryobacteraceae bacterium]
MKTLMNPGAMFLFAAMMILTGPMKAQEPAGARPAAPNGILGYLDAKTGAFRPVVRGPGEDSEIAMASVAPTTGKLVYSFTITVASAISTSQPIACTATASTSETNTTTYYSKIFDEQATAVATRSGSTATCTVTIPYSWSLSTPTSDSVQLGFVISSTATGTSTAVPSRLSSQSLAAIKVPANGVTTTEVIKVTI